MSYTWTITDVTEDHFTVVYESPEPSTVVIPRPYVGTSLDTVIDQNAPKSVRLPLTVGMRGKEVVHPVVSIHYV